jgi:homoserine kinase
MSVTLSGAGPAVMMLTQTGEEDTLKEAILELARPVCPIEILPTGLCREGAGMKIEG